MILAPPTRDRPAPPALERSVSHWTAREVPLPVLLTCTELTSVFPL